MLIAIARLLRAPQMFYGWYIVAASVAINFYLSLVFFQGFQTFFLPISEEFSWDRATTSGAFSLRHLETGLLVPVLGFVLDRWGARAVILSSVLVTGAGMVLMSFITNLWMFYGAFLIISFGASGASHGISWPVVIVNWFQRLRGRALGLACMGPVVSGPFLVTIAMLEDVLGWRASVRLLGFGVWVVGVPLALMARSEPTKYGWLPDGDPPEGKDEAVLADRTARNSADGMSVSEAIRTRSFWLLLAVLGLQFIGLNGLSVHLIPLLEDVGYSSAQAASILGLVYFLSGIGRFGSGIICDWIDRRLVLAGLLAAQVLAAVSLTLLGPSAYWHAGLFALFYGVGFGGVIPLRSLLVGDLFGSRAFGAIQGLIQGGAIVAGLFGPVFFGRVFDVTRSYDLALYISSAISAVAIPAAFLLRFPYRYARYQVHPAQDHANLPERI